MNSTRRPTIHSNANRAIGILFSAALFATIGFYASSVAAQQAAPSGTIETFPAGDNPYGLAFDGENIWVTNFNFSNSTVTKLRASDGTLLGSFPLPGSSATRITFDGENIWVVDTLSSSVYKLRASDGAYLGGLIIAQDPRGITFDGANVWVGHRTGPPREEGSVAKIRASDIQVLGVFPAGPRPRALTFDGANIWVVNILAESVTKLRASDGTLLDTFPIAPLHGGDLSGIVFDAGNIWVADSNTGRVFRFHASDGAFLGQHKVGKGAWGIASDGIHFGSPIFEATK